MVIPCSQTAVDEPLPGTAPHVRFWVAVEHPGPWSATAVSDIFDGFEPPPGIRVVCIRRSPRGIGRVFVADTENSRLHLVHVNAAEDVRTWDFIKLIQGQLPGEATDANPILVCTNGRRDQCCAIAGRPLLDHPSTWECTHLGGHRFAPVTLRLRDGYLFGRVTPAALDRIAQGEIPFAYARGRTALPAPEQAAEIFLLGGAQPGLRVVQEPIDVFRPESCGAEPNMATRWRIADGGVH